MTLEEAAEKLGISRQTLDKKLIQCKPDFLQDVKEKLGIALEKEKKDLRDTIIERQEKEIDFLRSTINDLTDALKGKK